MIPPFLAHVTSSESDSTELSTGGVIGLFVIGCFGVVLYMVMVPYKVFELLAERRREFKWVDKHDKAFPKDLSEGLEGCYQKLRPEESKILEKICILDEELKKLSPAKERELIMTKEREREELRALRLLDSNEATALAYRSVLDDFTNLHELKSHKKEVEGRLHISVCTKADQSDETLLKIKSSIVVVNAVCQQKDGKPAGGGTAHYVWAGGDTFMHTGG